MYNIFKVLDSILDSHPTNALLSYRLKDKLDAQIAYSEMSKTNPKNLITCRFCKNLFDKKDIVSEDIVSIDGNICKRCFYKYILGKCDICGKYDNWLYMGVPLIVCNKPDQISEIMPYAKVPPRIIWKNEYYVSEKDFNIFEEDLIIEAKIPNKYDPERAKRIKKYLEFDRKIYGQMFCKKCLDRLFAGCDRPLGSSVLLSKRKGELSLEIFLACLGIVFLPTLKEDEELINLMQVFPQIRQIIDFRRECEEKAEEIDLMVEEKIERHPTLYKNNRQVFSRGNMVSYIAEAVENSIGLLAERLSKSIENAVLEVTKRNTHIDILLLLAKKDLKPKYLDIDETELKRLFIVYATKKVVQDGKKLQMRKTVNKEQMLVGVVPKIIVDSLDASMDEETISLVAELSIEFSDK